MSILSYRPKRRSFLRAVTMAVLGAPIVRLGKVLRRRPRDVSPIPWIGHC